MQTTCGAFNLSHVVHNERVTENEFVAIRSQAHTAGPRMLQNSFTKWLLKNSGNYVSETVFWCVSYFCHKLEKLRKPNKKQCSAICSGFNFEFQYSSSAYLCLSGAWRTDSIGARLANEIPPTANYNSSYINKINVNTVKPVYNGHPWEMTRWPLYTGWPLHTGFL